MVHKLILKEEEGGEVRKMITQRDARGSFWRPGGCLLLDLGVGYTLCSLCGEFIAPFIYVLCTFAI